MQIQALNASLRGAGAKPKDAMAAAIAQVSQLDSKGLAELIVSMSEKISDQQTENDALKKAAERANQGLTLWKLATTLFGVVLAFAGAVLWFGGLWGDWKAVRNAHAFEQTNGQMIYGHEHLSEDDMVALRKGMNIPDAVDLSAYVKTGETVTLSFADNGRVYGVAASEWPQPISVPGGSSYVVVVAPGNSREFTISKPGNN